MEFDRVREEFVSVCEVEWEEVVFGYIAYAEGLGVCHVGGVTRGEEWERNGVDEVFRTNRNIGMCLSSKFPSGS